MSYKKLFLAFFLKCAFPFGLMQNRQGFQGRLEGVRLFRLSPPPHVNFQQKNCKVSFRASHINGLSPSFNAKIST